MNFIYVIHMLYWNHLITHSSSNRSNRNNSGNKDNKRGRARSPRADSLCKTEPQGGFSGQNGAPWVDSVGKTEPGAVGRSIFLTFL